MTPRGVAPPRGTLQIRRAAPEDAAELSALIQKAIRVTNAADYGPEVIEGLCAAFSPQEVAKHIEQDYVIVRLLDGQLAGTAGLAKSAGSIEEKTKANGAYHASGAARHVNSLFVDPGYQGQGVGRALIRDLEKHARESGAPALTANASFTAEAFYLSLGFVSEGRRSGGLGDTVFMRKGLGG